MQNIQIRSSWLAGFIEGDGCFFISILKNRSIALGYQVQLTLLITQHVRDTDLLKAICQFFGSGSIRLQKNTNVVHLRIRDFNTISTVLLPIFDETPLKTTKRHDLADFRLVHDIIKRREHLTQEGLDQIRVIKARMNRARKSTSRLIYGLLGYTIVPCCIF